ncbi:MAG: ion transporter [Actinomycetales bacterium]|nr:ion transporter [Actinomycetales bacterium]
MADEQDIDAAEEAAGLRNPSYEIFMAALSILSIINLVLAWFIADESMSYIIQGINFLLTLCFAGDFIYRLYTAKSRSHYFFRDFGWADMLASIPFAQTNALRVFRLIKVYRLLRDYGARNIIRSIIKDRADSALLSLFFVGIIMLEFGSLQMLRLEVNAPGANITNASDALWYVIVTMSTVGYGDTYPVTNPGRVMGIIIIVVGVGIFGTLTGFLANAFLSPKKERKQEKQPPTDVHAQLEALKELSSQQQAAIARLESLLGKSSG